MKIQENILLAPYTTFKIGGPAKYFCVVENQFDALEAFEFAKKNDLKIFLLGGGSNILISDRGFDGLVIKVVNKGIEVVSENNKEVTLKVASGEVWDEVVSFSVKNGWWGIENLSHIPGSSGAIAVQNVGAYGQEAKNVIDSVVVFNTQTHEIQSLNNKDCGFAYRRSIFNSEQKGKLIIFYIVFKLQKNGSANLNYRDLAVKFKDQSPELVEVRNFVIETRDKKFPYPTEAKKGNAGSFFKNPVLSQEKFAELKKLLSQKFTEKVAESLEQKRFIDGNLLKIPAAFLLDICGLKKLKIGGAVINESQPLVIINENGSATAQDVLELANEARKKVFEITGVNLDFEPELIGF